MRRRIKNIILKMCNKQDFYKDGAPYITQKEIEEIQQEIGELLQIEKIYGAEAGSPTAVYPLHPKRFEEIAKKLGLIE